MPDSTFCPQCNTKYRTAGKGNTPSLADRAVASIAAWRETRPAIAHDSRARGRGRVIGR